MSNFRIFKATEEADSKPASSASSPYVAEANVIDGE